MRGKSWPIKLILSYCIPKKFILWKDTTKTKTVALTFDDGPNPQYTEELLVILKKYQIKATFFLIASKAEKYPKITSSILRDGHTIGSHTFKHDLTTKMTISVFRNDLEICSRILKDISGTQCKYFRPPEGRITLAALHHCISQNITTVLWSLSSKDTQRKGYKYIINNVLGNGVMSGDIILFHDDNAYTLQALPEIIDKLNSRNYSFVTINKFVTK
jgi:peptidoglycan/xylan/chitin deacetylase (PgdA/CDA1 family)